MKLVDYTTAALIVQLPKDLLWVDEFDWAPVQTSSDYSITGSLILQRSLKLAGRSIRLKSPDSEMGWMYRADLALLRAAAASATQQMVLWLEKPNDTRTFPVIFADGDQIKATPVKGWADHEVDDPYTIEIHLMQFE